MASRSKLTCVHLTDLNTTAKPPAQSLVDRSTQGIVIPSPPCPVSPPLFILSPSSLFEVFPSAVGQLDRKYQNLSGGNLSIGN